MQNMGEAQEAGTPPRGFLSSRLMGHCSHGGMWLLPAAAYSAAPVPRIAAATEVAEDPSDGGDGVDAFCNYIYIYIYIYMYIKGQYYYYKG